MAYLHQNVTQNIIRCFYEVYNTLGYGFLEKVYERAMILELIANGLPAISQVPVKVSYRNEFVGDYFADIVVDGKIIIEIKAAETLVEEHELQFINYLKAPI